MMISGKSALRKKRFTWLSQRVPGGSPSGDSGDSGLFLRQQRRVEHAYIGQIPVSLSEIEAVTDHEAVRDLEADVPDGHLDLTPLGLRQERADLEARRLPCPEVCHPVRCREPRVEDVLDDEGVPALDL